MLPVVITARAEVGRDALSTVPDPFSAVIAGGRETELPELSDREDPEDALHPARQSAVTSRTVVTSIRLITSR
jgi:hypothetical protein